MCYADAEATVLKMPTDKEVVWIWKDLDLCYYVGDDQYSHMWLDVVILCPNLYTMNKDWLILVFMGHESWLVNQVFLCTMVRLGRSVTRFKSLSTIEFYGRLDGNYVLGRITIISLNFISTRQLQN